MITLTITIDELRHKVDVRATGQATEYERRLAAAIEDKARVFVGAAIEQTPPTLAGRGINGR